MHTPPEDDPRYNESAMNGPGYDFDGPIVGRQNEIAREMGWLSNIQRGYQTGIVPSDGRYNLLLLGNYTDGHGVDVVRFGDEALRTGGAASNDNIDHTLRTSKLNDLLFGFGGDDTIKAGKGNDYAYGGEGADTLWGGDENDVLAGENGDDKFYGEKGDDHFWGGALNQEAQSADGKDEVRYDKVGTADGGAIEITFGTTAGSELTVRDGDNGTDTLHSVERITGSKETDKLIIQALTEAVAGAKDWIDLGANPDGTDNGDLIDLSALTAGVKVDLAGERLELISNTAVGFRVTNAENVHGGKGNDTIIGNDASNRLRGGEGGDEIHGGGGNDIIDAASDGWMDKLYGGDGSDTFKVNGLDTIHDIDPGDTVWHGDVLLTGGTQNHLIPSQYVGADGIIYSWTEGSTTLTVHRPVGGGHDEIIIKNFQNGDGGIRLGPGAGTTGDDALNGGDGEDSLYGLAGNDTLLGGGGDDALDGGDGDDTFIVGLGHGFDAFEGGAGTDTIKATADSIVIGARSIANVETITANGFANVSIQTTDQSERWNFYSNTMIGITEIDVGGGDDRLVGHSTTTILRGGAGNDEIYSQEGDDNLFGGDGNDYLNGWHGNDRLVGAAGDDALYGDDGDDVLLPDTGIDFVDGGLGSDTVEVTYVTGALTVDLRLATNQAKFNATTFETWLAVENIVSGSGADTLIGTDAANRFTGGLGNDRLDGGGGGDTLLGEAGNDQLFGGDGDDLLIPYTGTDSIDGGAGSDTVDATYVTGALTVDLRLVADQAKFSATVFETWLGVEHIVSGSGADTLFGDAAANRFAGGLGNDRLEGGEGGDTLLGDGGDDLLIGGEEGDVLNGGTGSDDMRGGAGDDIFYVQQPGDVASENAAEGYDLVRAYLDHMLAANIEELRLDGAGRVGTGNGIDNLLAGSIGADRLSGLGGHDSLWGLSEADTLDGGDGNDIVYGGFSGDGAEGGAGDDRINGEEGDDLLSGGDGIDRLFGGDGRDTLAGGAGDDDLKGNLGKDTQTGGGGLDAFVFDDGDSSAISGLADIITDFSSADGDKVHLRQVDADSVAAGDQNFSFIGTAAFSAGGVGGELRYKIVQGNTYVEADLDGNGAVDLMIRLDGVHALTAADFVL
ncbi:MAG TPA: M10 family metallopeptidase C-terminal domain-containing protein [Allosphingosinicella sp.]|nr:M10 family metallopeptidase C-terminal domain-containing protein [Allosphingosinicella sp.]